MKHVKRYKELFEAQTELTNDQKEWLDKCTSFKSWTINPQTGLVDVEGSFDCSSQRLIDFKGVGFGVVSGNFYCYDNELPSLKGAPQEVKVNFDCYDIELTSLKDAPKKVGGDFNCSYNNLTSLKDAPQEVGGGFDCSGNELTSLEGAPREVGGGFDCSSNPVSESVLKSLYKKMQSGMSWPDAVASQWRYIRSVDDKILLAPYNNSLSPDEKAYYRAIGALKRRSI